MIDASGWFQLDKGNVVFQNKENGSVLEGYATISIRAGFLRLAGPANFSGPGGRLSLHNDQALILPESAVVRIEVAQEPRGQ